MRQLIIVAIAALVGGCVAAPSSSRQDVTAGYPHEYIVKPTSVTRNNRTRVPKIGITFEVLQGKAKGMKFATGTAFSPSIANRLKTLVEDKKPVSVFMKTDLLVYKEAYHKEVYGVPWRDIDPELWKEGNPNKMPGHIP